MGIPNKVVVVVVDDIIFITFEEQALVRCRFVSSRLKYVDLFVNCRYFTTSVVVSYVLSVTTSILFQLFLTH